ncbi:DUF3397 domain-containing protein [Bacillus sp. 2205SS5-2]|uniref:DUF3397 domain-containing protein n=1 Tax=Bacillus sp. 2205SS5-2 TaxID=3109031 RepID=UPI00300515B5
MTLIFSSVGGFLVTMPFLVYFFVFIIMKQSTKNHRKAVNVAIDTSTVFLFFSVHFIILTIWERSYIWLLVLMMLVMATLFVLMYWKVKKEIIFPKLFKGLWRVSFLLLSLAYVFLLLYGVVSRILMTI